MIILLVHPAAKSQHNRHICKHQQMEPYGRNCRLNDNFPEIADKKVDWVHQKCTLHRIAVLINCVENGGHIHEQHGKHRPQILDVPKKYKKRRQNKTNTNIKQHQAENGIQQAD